MTNLQWDVTVWMSMFQYYTVRAPPFEASKITNKQSEIFLSISRTLSICRETLFSKFKIMSKHKVKKKDRNSSVSVMWVYELRARDITKRANFKVSYFWWWRLLYISKLGKFVEFILFGHIFVCERYCSYCTLVSAKFRATSQLQNTL